jgi:seryl-tRNA(Sec) selenium transferase
MLTDFNNDDAPDISPSPSGFSSENLRKCAEVIQFMETLQEFEVDLEDELLKAIQKISAMPSFQKARAIYDQNAYLAAQELSNSWRQKVSDLENAHIDARTNLIKQKAATLKIIEDNAALEEANKSILKVIEDRNTLKEENETMREHLKKLGYEMVYVNVPEPEPESSPD